MNTTIPHAATSCPPACDDAGIRFRYPDRSACVDPRIIDRLIPADHEARLVWEWVCGLDLSGLLAGYRARHGCPGRAPIDVRLLVTLWLFATREGVDTARELDRLCRRDDVYRWICGGVAVNYHTLADFRVEQADWLQQQTRNAVTALHRDGLVPLQRIGLDGLRLRASAGSDSMKTADVLRAELHKADTRLQSLEAEDRAALPRRSGRRRTKKEAACLRGARDRCGRLRRALEEMERTALVREKRKKGDGATTRLSATDPQARRMKMPDGGFRPAFNVQFGTDLDALVPIGTQTINAGNDAGQAVARQEQLEADYGIRPKTMYADGGFATREDIQTLAARDIVFYTPIKCEQRRKAEGQDPSQRRKGESDEVAAWRQRMSTPEGKAEYRRRGITEWTNAAARRHGLERVSVRGLDKVGAVVLWYMLTIVLLRGFKLHAQAAAPTAAAVAAECVVRETVTAESAAAEPPRREAEGPGGPQAVDGG